MALQADQLKQYPDVLTFHIPLIHPSRVPGHGTRDTGHGTRDTLIKMQKNKQANQ